MNFDKFAYRSNFGKAHAIPAMMLSPCKINSLPKYWKANKLDRLDYKYPEVYDRIAV